jgi:hypothetical protein
MRPNISLSFQSVNPSGCFLLSYSPLYYTHRGEKVKGDLFFSESFQVGFVDPGLVPHSTAPITVTSFAFCSLIKMARSVGLEPT